MNRGMLFIISGPSGVGKGTLRERAVAGIDRIKFSVSCTTRAPRHGEVNGVHYHFLSKEEFQKRLDNEEFLEHAVVHGDMYGTLRSDVTRELDAGNDVILEIDVQGAFQVKKQMVCILTFIFPPSLKDLAERLRLRGTESEEKIQTRLENARLEMDRAGAYDHLIVNDDLECAAAQLRNVIIKYRQRYQWAQTIAVTGALGSGKSEWVLNLAMELKMCGQSVTIADADIINPYFCIRQVVEQLQAQGFKILLPPESGKWSDMSLISPLISAALADRSSKLLLDIGGDASGVRALKQFEHEIIKSSYLLILVVNSFRPLTSTPEKIEKMARRMEEICNLHVGALVCNSHVMSQTTPDDILAGTEIAKLGAERLGLPLLYTTATEELFPATLEKMRTSGGDYPPLWKLKRYLKLPWEGEEMWSSRTPIT